MSFRMFKTKKTFLKPVWVVKDFCNSLWTPRTCHNNLNAFVFLDRFADLVTSDNVLISPASYIDQGDDCQHLSKPPEL